MKEELLKGLTDEQLEAISGGSICAPACPNCGTKNMFIKKVPRTNMFALNAVR